MPRGFNSQGAYLKGELDSLLKSLSLLKISVSERLEPQTCSKGMATPLRSLQLQRFLQKNR